jgi:hypothetical protein
MVVSPTVRRTNDGVSSRPPSIALWCMHAFLVSLCVSSWPGWHSAGAAVDNAVRRTVLLLSRKQATEHAHTACSLTTRPPQVGQTNRRGTSCFTTTGFRGRAWQRQGLVSRTPFLWGIQPEDKQERRRFGPARHRGPVRGRHSNNAPTNKQSVYCWDRPVLSAWLAHAGGPEQTDRSAPPCMRPKNGMDWTGYFGAEVGKRVRSEKKEQPGRHSFFVVGQRLANSEQRRPQYDKTEATSPPLTFVNSAISSNFLSTAGDSLYPSSTISLSTAAWTPLTWAKKAFSKPYTCSTSMRSLYPFTPIKSEATTSSGAYGSYYSR